MTSERFAAAIEAIDRANADDPTTIVVDGVERAKEQAHAELMTTWVTRLDPAAGEQQLLAARAHHLRRWTLPRDAYPAGRAGYLRWRAEQKRRHAEDVGAILRDCGYADDEIERVQCVIAKKGLGTDAAVQVHEDALCLVFLETQLGQLVSRLGEEKSVEVLRKTLGKMSEEGRRAVGRLPLSPDGLELVARASETSSA